MRTGIVLIILCVLSGCSILKHKASVPSVDHSVYNSWMEDPSNGMITHAAAGDSVSWICFYTTPEYELIRGLQDANVDARGAKDSLIAFRKEQNGDRTMYHFSLRVECRNDELKKKLNKFPSLAAYVQSEMKQDLQLVMCGDTLFPVFYHFENTLDIMPAATVMISFESKRRSDCDMTLLYTDRLLTYELYRFAYPVYYLARMPDPR